MNLSPDWVPLLRVAGFEAIHWSSLGAYNAPDREIMQWARNHDAVVLTHDLDFGILLAHSLDEGPCVVQVRTQDVSPEHLGPIVVRSLQVHCEALVSGALLTMDESKSRVRILRL